MGIVSLPNLGPDPFTVNASVLNGKVDPLATEFNGNIDNANIDASAAIVASKLDLSTIAQDIAMSSSQILWAKGADVASGTSIALGTDGNVFDITGTTTIQTITAKQAGSVVVLHFDGALTLTDDTGNLELQGADLTVAAEDEIILKSDGTNWHLVAYSAGVDVTRNFTWTGTHDFTGATVSGIVDFASAAEVKTGTEAAKAVAPNTMVSHEGVVKGWINFDGSGTPSITSSFNVTGSITDNNTGDFTFSWDTDFGGTTYALAGFSFETGNVYNYVSASDAAPAAGTVRVFVIQHNGTAQDATGISVIAIGDR